MYSIHFKTLTVLLTTIISLSVGCTTTRYVVTKRMPSTHESFTHTAETSAGLKKKVAIIDFWNDTTLDLPNLEAFTSIELEKALNSTSNVLAIREETTPLYTKDFVQNNFVKVEQLSRTARKMGVTAVLIGKITNIKFQKKNQDVGILSQSQLLCDLTLEVKAFDIHSSREILSLSKNSQSNRTLYSKEADQEQELIALKNDTAQFAVQQAISGLLGPISLAVEKLSWQGHIADIRQTLVYINAGKTSGIGLGDILRVLTNGEDIYDPLTGAYLGHSSGRMKGTLEVFDFIGSDGAIARIHSGGNFSVGDTVELY